VNSPMDAYRDWDVAYVLGSLSPSDRKDYERHLAACASCANQVASLAGIPGILSAVPRDQAAEMLGASYTVPAALLRGPVGAVRASRRRTRVRVAAAYACAAALGALLATVVCLSLPEVRSPG
jgi:RNA polymerase sigma-70 factor (ECF subfamily)